MTSMQNRQERIADPGFAAAMNQKELAVAELRGLGVPEDAAIVLVQRVFTVGQDRGLHLGLRRLGAIPKSS